MKNDIVPLHYQEDPERKPEPPDFDIESAGDSAISFKDVSDALAVLMRPEVAKAMDLLQRANDLPAVRDQVKRHLPKLYERAYAHLKLEEIEYVIQRNRQAYDALRFVADYQDDLGVSQRTVDEMREHLPNLIEVVKVVRRALGWDPQT